ncbi:MAG: hypothetical protein KAS32_08085 [Candidatus Peribacteraceae bacterium]|nr:hypothetical protein [Candidatus Peribacteraceae bacterium]
MDYSILIPLNKGSKWSENELRYTLRSIDKYFDFDYDITIYSDHKIDWLKNVNLTIVPRYYPDKPLRTFGGTKHYENYYDTLNKVKLASLSDDLNENILYVYDDILLLKTQDKEQIKTLYAGGRYMDKQEYWNNPRGNKWRNTIFQAIDRARGYGEVFLYETHLPRYYEKSKLREMFKMFPIDQMDIPYAMATLYYNMFYSKPDMLYLLNKETMDNPIKAGFYGSGNNLCDVFPSKTMEQIEKHTIDKLWVSYNDAGLTDALKKWIQTRYKKKCKFEK